MLTCHRGWTSSPDLKIPQQGHCMSTRICYTAPPSEPKSYGYTGSRVCCQRLKDLECRWPGNGPYCLQRSRGSPAAGKTEKRSCLAHSHSMCKPERTAAQAASPTLRRIGLQQRPCGRWPLLSERGTTKSSPATRPSNKECSGLSKVEPKAAEADPSF